MNPLKNTVISFSTDVSWHTFYSSMQLEIISSLHPHDFITVAHANLVMNAVIICPPWALRSIYINKCTSWIIHVRPDNWKENDFKSATERAASVIWKLTVMHPSRHSLCIHSGIWQSVFWTEFLQSLAHRLQQWKILVLTTESTETNSINLFPYRAENFKYFFNLQ